MLDANVDNNDNNNNYVVKQQNFIRIIVDSNNKTLQKIMSLEYRQVTYD
jgi:hypothetical protein